MGPKNRKKLVFTVQEMNVKIETFYDGGRTVHDS